MSSNAVAPPAFANFQFQTIGQPPDLLKRMSIANPEYQVHEDPYQEISLSPEPDLVNELIPSESLGNTPDLPKPPSLHERLAMSVHDEIETNPGETTTASRPSSSSIFSWKSSQIKSALNSSVAPHEGSVAREDAKSSAISHSVYNVPLNLSPSMSKQSSRSPLILRDHGSKSQNSDVLGDRYSIQTDLQSQQASHNSPETTTSAVISVVPEPPIFSALQALQTGLAMDLADLSRLNVHDTVVLARGAKTQYLELSTVANNAYLCAQKALSSAEESLTAAKDCVRLAEIIQARTDEIIAAVEQIGNTDRQKLWNDSLKRLTARLHELDEWKLQYRREHEADTESQQITAGCTPSGPSLAANDLIPLSDSTDNTISDLRAAVEEEADVIARAWSRQKAERDKEAQEVIQRHRMAEEAARAKRIEVEEKEKYRLVKEAKQAEMQKEVLEKKKEEARVRMEEKEKVLQLEREEILRKQDKQRCKDASDREAVQRQEEQRRKEKERENALQQRLMAEKEQALEAQRHQQHEQWMKIAAEKQQAAVEDARKIQSKRAKAKQQTQAPENDITMHTHDKSLPVSPGYEPLLQIKFPSHREDSLTLPNKPLSENLRGATSVEILPSETADSNNLLEQIVELTTSLNRPVTITSGFNSNRELCLLHTPPPAAIEIPTAKTTNVFRSNPVLTQQMGKEKHPPTSLPPPIPGLPKKPVQSNNQSQATLTQRHQFASISPTTQKANLRPLANADTNPECVKTKVKTEPGDDNHLPKPERVSTGPTSSESSYPDNNRSHVFQVKRKAESPSIPFLTLPSPPAEATTFKQTASPMELISLLPEVELSSLKPNLEHQAKKATPLPSTAPYRVQTVSTLAGNQNQNHMGSQRVDDILAPPEALSLHNPSITTMLPQPPHIQDAPKHNTQYHDYDTGSGIGPDTLKAYSWTQHSTSQENVPNERQTARVRSPRPPRPPLQPTKRHIEPRSPPTPPPPRANNNLSQQQQKVKFSRHKEPHNGYASPHRSRSRESNGNNSRMVTPESPLMPMYQMGESLKRKRPNDQFTGPPQRRPRYDDRRTPEGGPPNSRPGTQYALTSARNGFQPDWSNVANYSRSPTPEHFQPPPLCQRLDESDRHYRPDQALSNDRTELYKRQPSVQSSSFRGADYQRNQVHMQRTSSIDSRLPLLDRFTDSPSHHPRSNNQNNHVQHPGSGRGPAPRTRGRGGANQSSGPRANKGHLIDRLGDP
ncbi:hypothetical protein BDN70DRAFT_879488 [Pholiota conissans]|uniref:Uncharacterized protein n=1 Tax=Pholiota conissans TaxID=109636 RepID=A0A9P6CTT6_9AGAR|nr:hypothetical protein BDN70DRAFT_879488 [Pholiota conissans]